MISFIFKSFIKSLKLSKYPIFVVIINIIIPKNDSIKPSKIKFHMSEYTFLT